MYIDKVLNNNAFISLDENGEEILVPVESDFEIEMIEEAYATLFADEEE